MEHLIDRLLKSGELTADGLRSELKDLQETLEILRVQGTISNDAYLDAGAIEGGLNMLANLIELQIPESEVAEHLRQLKERAGRIDKAHPSLGKSVKDSRQ